MPAERRTTAGVSSSVALFLLIISTCFVLSLFSNRHKHRNHSHDDDDEHNWVGVPHYVPNTALFWVTATGVVTMVVFIVKRNELTTPDPESHVASRHNRHSRYILYSITGFFIGDVILDLNYIIVELQCTNSWLRCDFNEHEFFLVNFFEVVFRFSCIVFASCETIVCWMLKCRNFKPLQWVWHGLAVVQAANLALWFESVLKEAKHRIKDDEDVFEAYFSFCNTTMENANYSSAPAICSGSSFLGKWFLLTIPILFPFAIEFTVLVSKTLLGRSVAVELHTSSDDDEEGSRQQDDEDTEAEDTSDDALLLTDNFNREDATRSSRPIEGQRRSQVFILISVIINIVLLIISFLVVLNHHSQWDARSQTIDDVYTVYLMIYYIYLIFSIVVGILTCRKFGHQPSRTTFLEYLLLFSTCGILLQALKRIVTFSVNIHSFDSMIPIYHLTDFLDIVEAPSQIVLYYYAKNVKVPVVYGHNRRLTEDRQNARHFSVVVFKTIMTVMTVSNLANWILDSFLFADLSIVTTPSQYYVQTWPVFDNMVAPISIFFRFNSALLFWCLVTDISQRRHSQQPDDCS